ncbi:prepilin-type N-terminal cleavage/methylation domain-containing protein [Clostridium omnivorum]|uniref:Prepilin-type N-terminal cleavage/methylation domain-containing protein n=1 Tax=Clostridium omnivorum TaxID=1604902 RepID=A0ABQ5NB35_9CLOT|nr:prepilin-type N-terminal cleavage/methylation domain-containing protein [Clostridium sp. E14]GLC32416.1 hypothetical protein bsdE14_38260 [Clostridium sp. E14]
MKKGFTLIEIIIAAALASVVLTIGSYVLVTSTKLYKNEIARNKYMYYLKEASMYIESEVQNSEEIVYKGTVNEKYLKITSIEVNENKLTIHRAEQKIEAVPIDYRKEIFLNTQKNLVVTYYENSFNKGINNITTHLKTFVCSKMGNIIYLSMESENGDRFERCIEVSVLN